MIHRVGLVTGCGKGIGLAICKKFLQEEKETFIIAISKSINEEINLLIEQYPSNFRFVKSDIIDYKKIDTIFKNIYEEFGRIDFAICNAGVRSRSSIIDSDLNLYRSVFEVNCVANINISKLLIEKNSKINII